MLVTRTSIILLQCVCSVSPKLFCRDVAQSFRIFALKIFAKIFFLSSIVRTNRNCAVMNSSKLIIFKIVEEIRVYCYRAIFSSCSVSDLILMCRLTSPCDGCAAPYGFKNQLNLTEDTARFKVRTVCCL